MGRPTTLWCNNRAFWEGISEMWYQTKYVPPSVFVLEKLLVKSKSDQPRTMQRKEYVPVPAASNISQSSNGIRSGRCAWCLSVLKTDNSIEVTTKLCIPQTLNNKFDLPREHISVTGQRLGAKQIYQNQTMIMSALIINCEKWQKIRQKNHPASLWLMQMVLTAIRLRLIASDLQLAYCRHSC